MGKMGPVISNLKCMQKRKVTEVTEDLQELVEFGSSTALLRAVS